LRVLRPHPAQQPVGIQLDQDRVVPRADSGHLKESEGSFLKEG
jgi:hypothetical protein